MVIFIISKRNKVSSPAVLAAGGGGGREVWISRFHTFFSQFPWIPPLCIVSSFLIPPSLFLPLPLYFRVPILLSLIFLIITTSVFVPFPKISHHLRYRSQISSCVRWQFVCSAGYFKNVLIQDGGTHGSIKYGGIKAFARHCAFTVMVWFWNGCNEALLWLLNIFFVVFSVRNLLRSGAITKQPVWFPVVDAFPPLTETKLNRKGDEELMHKIMYPEDEFRK